MRYREIVISNALALCGCDNLCPPWGNHPDCEYHQDGTTGADADPPGPVIDGDPCEVLAAEAGAVVLGVQSNLGFIGAAGWATPLANDVMWIESPGDGHGYWTPSVVANGPWSALRKPWWWDDLRFDAPGVDFDAPLLDTPYARLFHWIAYDDRGGTGVPWPVLGSSVASFDVAGAPTDTVRIAAAEMDVSFGYGKRPWWIIDDPLRLPVGAIDGMLGNGHSAGHSVQQWPVNHEADWFPIAGWCLVVEESAGADTTG